MNHSISNATEAGRLLIATTGHSASQSGIATQDWDLLFCAVTERLGQCATHLLTIGSVAQQTPFVIRFSSDVLECVDALSQLHTDLRQQRQNTSD